MTGRPRPRRLRRGPVLAARKVADPPRRAVRVGRVGVADTTFARVDMAGAAIDALSKSGYPVVVERYTVPGMKDLALACQILLQKRDCDLALALGWVGGHDIDETCAHEANLALQWAELACGKHILKVFVHERETGDPSELARIALDRAREHALNAAWLLFDPERLTKLAGTGQRQGGPDVGPL